MNSGEMLETLKAANDLIAKQKEEILRLRLAVALLEYKPPRRETRGRKRLIPTTTIDGLIKLEPTLKEYFSQTGERYSRERWVYKALRILGISPSEWRAKTLQKRAIKNMIERLNKIPK